MKRKINVKKINTLLKSKDKTQKELATAINLPESNLSAALKEKKNRTLPMGYVIDIATFFNVEPIDITISCINDTKTTDVAQI